MKKATAALAAALIAGTSTAGAEERREVQGVPERSGRSETPSDTYRWESARCERTSITEHAEAGFVRHEVRCEWPGGAAGRIVLEGRCARGKDGRAIEDGTTRIGRRGRETILEPEVENALFDTLHRNGAIRHGNLVVEPFDGERTLLIAHRAACTGTAMPGTGEPVPRGWRLPPEIRDVAWVERYTRRPNGPCHWLGLAPLRASTRGPNSGAVMAYDARSASHVPAPALLADCCTASGTIEERALIAWIEMDRLAGDPGAWQVTNPLHWLPGLASTFFSDGRFYDETALVTLERTGPAGGPTWEWRAPIRRESVQWSTESGYQITLGSSKVIEAFRSAGAYDLRIEAPGLESRAHFVTGEKTEAFIEACRGTLR